MFDQPGLWWLAAALAELAAVGLGRMTMEGIARRAGTAKTSLYRRWSSPHDVLLDAIAREHPQEVPSPSADDLRGDLIRALGQLVAWLETPTAAAVVVQTDVIRRRGPPGSGGDDLDDRQDVGDLGHAGTLRTGSSAAPSAGPRPARR